jgi:hypothetical protein
MNTSDRQDLTGNRVVSHRHPSRLDNADASAPKVVAPAALSKGIANRSIKLQFDRPMSRSCSCHLGSRELQDSNMVGCNEGNARIRFQLSNIE